MTITIRYKGKPLSKVVLEDPDVERVKELKRASKIAKHDRRVKALVKIGRESGCAKLLQEIAVHQRKIADLREAIDQLTRDGFG